MGPFGVNKQPKRMKKLNILNLIPFKYTGNNYYPINDQ